MFHRLLKFYFSTNGQKTCQPTFNCVEIPENAIFRKLNYPATKKGKFLKYFYYKFRKWKFDVGDLKKKKHQFALTIWNFPLEHNFRKNQYKYFEGERTPGSVWGPPYISLWNCVVFSSFWKNYTWNIFPSVQTVFCCKWLLISNNLRQLSSVQTFTYFRNFK